MARRGSNINTVIKALKNITGAQIQSVEDSVRYYARSLFRTNFTRTGTRELGYRKLTPKYAKYKRSKVGNKPILQFSGALMRAALSTVKVNRIGNNIKMSCNVPSYGVIQANIGRDWTRVSKRNFRKMLKYARKQIRKNRKKISPASRISKRIL